MALDTKLFINRLIEKISSTAVISGIQEEKLKELLGHTPFEVLVGALLGIVVAFLFRSYLIYIRGLL